MKPVTFLSLIIIHCADILVPYHTCAQSSGFGMYQAAYPNFSTISNEQKKKNHFTIFYWNTGLFMFKKKEGKFIIGFPYERRDSSDQVTQQNYASDRQNPFNENAIMIDLINIAHSTKKNYYTAGAGLTPNYDGYYFDIGYGYNLYAPRFNGDIRKNSFIVRPSFSLYYFNVEERFDNIYNNKQDLKILGYYANTHYDITSLGGEYTETSEYVKVKFIQATIFGVPELSINTNPFQKKINYGLVCSWFIPITSKSGLQLTQKATDHNGNALNDNYSDIPLTHTDVTATLDDKILSHSPYRFSGFYAGIRFGFRLK